MIRDDDPDRSVLVEDRPRGGDALATAHWGADRIGYRWSEGAVETTAFVLRALLAIDPDHALVEPATTWLADESGEPLPNNDAYLAALDNPLVVPELAAFNVELNGSPSALTGKVFSRLHDELAATWRAWR